MMLRSWITGASSDWGAGLPLTIAAGVMATALAAPLPIFQAVQASEALMRLLEQKRCPGCDLAEADLVHAQLGDADLLLRQDHEHRHEADARERDDVGDLVNERKAVDLVRTPVLRHPDQLVHVVMVRYLPLDDLPVLADAPALVAWPTTPKKPPRPCNMTPKSG